MKSILFLSVVMEQGWGVSLEIGEICRRLRRDGVKAFVGAQRIDSSFDWLNVFNVQPTVKDVRALARKLGVSVIAAQTFPYFELLPELSDEFETWAWVFAMMQTRRPASTISWQSPATQKDLPTPGRPSMARESPRRILSLASSSDRSRQAWICTTGGLACLMGSL